MSAPYRVDEETWVRRLRLHGATLKGYAIIPLPSR